MDKRLIEKLNLQTNHEITNFYIYKNFSGIADYQSLLGAVNWFDKQSQEEYKHFDRFYSFICDIGEIPKLEAIPAPESTNITLQQMFEKTVEIEKGTTELLRKLYDLAVMLKESTAIDLIEQYLNEQVEEVKVASDILARIRLAGTGLGEIIIDSELAKR